MLCYGITVRLFKKNNKKYLKLLYLERVINQAMESFSKFCPVVHT